jgi:hypothetical protein
MHIRVSWPSYSLYFCLQVPLLQCISFQIRWMFPLLLRSYHSLVGWNVRDSLMGWGQDLTNLTSWDGPIVAAFGGMSNGIDMFSGGKLFETPDSF